MSPLKLNIHDLIMVLEHLRDKEGVEELILSEYGETLAISDVENPEEILISFDDHLDANEKSEIH
jgi:hypothetical protein